MVVVCSLIVCFFCRYTKKPCSIGLDIKSIIQPGDLVLSVGNSFKSDVVRILESNSGINYSHVGIVLCSNSNSINVVHMSIDKGCIVNETIQDFAETSNATELGLYRLRDPPNRERLYQVVDSLIKIKKKFDRTFDLNNDDGFYCSEMVYKVLKETSPITYKKIEYQKYLYPADLINKKIAIEIKKIKT